jgi:hypothetical protein
VPLSGRRRGTRPLPRRAAVFVEARTRADRFHTMIEKRIEVDLGSWIAVASQSPIASVGSGITNTSPDSTLPRDNTSRQSEGLTNKPNLAQRTRSIRTT